MTNVIRRDQPSPRRLLARILDSPSLVATVQALEPAALGKLIRHIGLEDCGEIVSLATTEQIRKIFDEDLWKCRRPGKAETFDAARFGTWLEVMLEAGEDFVAERLMDLPEDFVTYGLCRYILVIKVDPVAVEEDADGGDYLTDKAFESCLSQEIGDYHVISRQHEGWDTILSILLALDKHDHELLERILKKCFRMSEEYIEENGGLYDVLTSDELLEEDVAGDREERRAEEGYVAPTAAASFLALCREQTLDETLESARDAVTRAYFRNVKPAAASRAAKNNRVALGSGEATSADLEAMIGDLDEPELPRVHVPKQLLGGDSATTAAPAMSTLFTQSLSAIVAEDPSLHAQRLDELAYLCNVLVAGCEVDGRAFRPFEAVVAVAAVCNLGLDYLVKQEGGKLTAKAAVLRATAALKKRGAEKIFGVGMRLLSTKVSTSACTALAESLLARAKRSNDADEKRRLERFAANVREAVSTQKPWLPRARLLQSEFLEPAKQQVLIGLLSPYPYLVPPLARDAGGRYELDKDRELIATDAQIQQVTKFLSGL